MGKNPAFQFYPKDWRSDIELQSCSLEARGLWIELICLMHLGTPYGYLTANTADKPTDNQVAKWVGIHPVKYRKLLKELLDRKVAKIDEQGRIYCKRMLEDQQLRETRRQAGLKGGNPLLVKQKVKHNGYPGHTPPPSPTPSLSPNNNSSSAANNNASKRKNDEQQNFKALKGLCLKIEKKWDRKDFNPWQFVHWAISEEEGCPGCLIEDILPAFEALLDNDSVDNPYAWCGGIAKAKKRQRETRKREENWEKVKLKEMRDIGDWLKRIRNTE
jgi:hypothetical protein